MRLLEAEGPDGRKVRHACQQGIFAMLGGRVFGEDEEQVLRLRRLGGAKDTGVSSEIEDALRMIEIQRPTGRADEPGDWRPGSIQRRVGPVFAVLISFDDTAPVELMSTFSQPEYRRIP